MREGGSKRASEGESGGSQLGGRLAFSCEVGTEDVEVVTEPEDRTRRALRDDLVTWGSVLQPSPFSSSARRAGATFNGGCNTKMASVI